MSIMKINVRFAGMMRIFAGRQDSVIELPSPSTLGDLLLLLAEDLPEEFKTKVIDPLQVDSVFPMIMMVNRENIRDRAQFERPLADGDLVIFVPPMEGG
jgi:molybdopterin converting factor small subunit